jgi:hypothetical protein
MTAAGHRGGTGETNLGLLRTVSTVQREHTEAELEALTNDNIVHLHLMTRRTELDEQQDFERLARPSIIDLWVPGGAEKIGYDVYMGVENFARS